MSKLAGSDLMFDENDVRSTSKLLPRLIRVIFFGLSITNTGYLERYSRSWNLRFRDKSRKEFSQKAAADRKFLLDNQKLTFNMMASVLSAMGYDVVGCTVRLRDSLTGELLEFSTDDTVDALKERVEKAKEVGISGIA